MEQRGGAGWARDGTREQRSACRERVAALTKDGGRGVVPAKGNSAPVHRQENRGDISLPSLISPYAAVGLGDAASSPLRKSDCQ